MTALPPLLALHSAFRIRYKHSTVILPERQEKDKQNFRIWHDRQPGQQEVPSGRRPLAETVLEGVFRAPTP